jgi:hypothetical protein
VRDRLRHVYWIGGGSGGGKSTVAGRLAEEYGCGLYPTDGSMLDHAGRTTPSESPELGRFMAMTMDERWAARTPEEMLATFHWYRGEAFDLIVEDLLRFDGPVVAEGFRLLPALVAPLLADRTRAVWLLPTPDFRRAALESRGELWKIAGRTSDPDRALNNLLTRDAMFTERLVAEVASLGLQAIQVDGSLSEDDLVAAVAARLTLSSS